MKNTNLLAIITVIMLASSVSAANFTNSAFAQDVGFGATTKTVPGITNKGVTGSQNTQSSKQSIALNPSIKLVPNSGPAGTEFTVHGSGFYPGQYMAVTSPWGSPTGRVDSSGISIMELQVAADAAPGTYEINAYVTGSFKDYGAIKQGSSMSAKATFTVTGSSNTVNTKTGHNSTPPPPPPPPPTQPTNTATGGGITSVPYITLDPTSGFPGTEVKITGGNFEGEVTLSVGGKVTAKSTDITTGGDQVNTKSDGSLSGLVVIPSDAQPGPYPIQVDSSGPTAKAIFTVLKEPTFADTKTTPTLKGPSSTSTPNSGKTGTNTAKSLTTPGTTSSSTSNSGSSNQPQSKSNSIVKNSKSGASFYVIKTVVGGDANPADFNFNVVLTGPSGSAKYSLNLNGAVSAQNGADSEFNLNLPQGNTLSEGSFQIVETNPMGYTPTYDKGCSGTYDMDGYRYICHVTNTKVIPNSITSVAKGGTPPPLPGVTSGKSTLPTTSNTGKLTLPTTNKPTGITTPGKSTGTITPKPPVVHSCPVGSIAANGKCVSKGKVVGVLQ